MTENLIKGRLKKYLHAIGAYYLMPVQMGYGSVTLDFLVCHRGLFYGIETKREGIDEPTPRQKLTMQAIEAAGGSCWVENSPELTETRKHLFVSQMRDDPVIWKTL